MSIYNFVVLNHYKRRKKVPNNLLVLSISALLANVTEVCIF